MTNTADDAASWAAFHLDMEDNLLTTDDAAIWVAFHWDMEDNLLTIVSERNALVRTAEQRAMHSPSGGVFDKIPPEVWPVNEMAKA